jgi:hypothetical protein
MTRAAAEVFRDYETDGVPASGAHEVVKRDAREMFETYEALLAGSGPMLAYATLAYLNADLAHAANVMAMVYADSTAANNGIYVKAGISGAGSWSRIDDLPWDIVPLTVTGGTGNAILATAPFTPTTPGRHLYLIVPAANNTAATTIAVNGGSAVAIKNAFNANLASGSLMVGNAALMMWSIDHYQLLIAAAVDGNAILADAQAAAISAAADAAIAAAAVSAYNAVTEGGADNTGSTNAYAALVAAETAAQAAGKALRIPAGTYDITGHTWRLKSNMVYLADMGRTFIKRTADTTIGTVEAYNITNTVVSGLDILTTLTTHTLGYGQTGFCARNGSTKITFVDCSVEGELNRKFHCINSADVTFLRCRSPYGEGNATLRIVSDHDADVYPEMSDENSPIQCKNITVMGCTFYGCSTDGGVDRVVSYGIDVASVNDASDLCTNIKLIGNSVQYYTSQGLAAGGRVSHVTIALNYVSDIYTNLSGDGGTGILAALSFNGPTFVNITGNQVVTCDQGIYSTQSAFVTINGNQVDSCLTNNILVSAGNDIVVNANIVTQSGGKGIYITGSATDASVTNNISRSNTGVGIQTDSGVTGILLGNTSLGNGTQYTNNGTMIVGNTGTPVGNK